MNFKVQLKKAYDSDAKRRSDNESRREDWKSVVRNKFCQLLKSEGKTTLLELGAGIGTDSRYFVDQGFKVLATDLSDEMVKLCKKNGLNARVLDLYDLSQLNSTFDGVYALNVLLHVPRQDLKEILGLIHSVLNDDGIFFYGVYGGQTKEKFYTDKTKMNMERFFSFLSDEDLLTVVKDRFDVIDFEVIKTELPEFPFQSLTLRKRIMT